MEKRTKNKVENGKRRARAFSTTVRDGGKAQAFKEAARRVRRGFIAVAEAGL